MAKKAALLIVALVVGGASTAWAAVDADMQVWYKLDETDGNTAHDDSMYGRDAVVDGPSAGPAWEPEGGRWGGSLAFNDNTDIEVPTSVLSSLSSAITVSVWLKDSYRPSENNWVFDAEGSSDSVVQAAVAAADEEALWRAGNDSNDVLTWDFDGEDHTTIEGWHHWVFVKDEVAGNISMYFDSRLVESNDVVNSTLANVKGVALRIGAVGTHANDYVGHMDDIRVYDVALTAEEVLELFWGGLKNARAPSPENEAENICPGASLCWTPGDSAAEHDVYLGTDYNDVNDADTSSGVYIDRLGPNCFTPDLDMGTTYYWRIDEVNDPCVWKGEVWQLTTNDGSAFNPDPADEQTMVSREPMLSWTPGCLATSHKVYFSADYNDVNDRQAAAYVGEVVGPNTIDPCAGELEYSTYYYWVVDGNDGVNTWPGRVWSFRSESPIIDVNMVVWYKLDETGGDEAPDSSGYENHGSLVGDDNWDPNDGRYGGSLVFDDDTVVLCPKAAMSKISKGITVALWLKDADRPGSDNWVFEVPGSPDVRVQAAVVEEDDEEVYWQAGSDGNDVITWDLDGADASKLQGWHHWAFVKCEDPPEVSIYFDGFVVESNDVVDNTLLTVRGQRFRLGVGAGQGNSFVGKMDDVRIFDKALSPMAVAALYRGGDLGLAWAPSPGDFATDVPRDSNVAWEPGDYATGHKVYFGTDWDDVNDMTEPCATPGIGNELYDPGILDLRTTYYWRVDEVNDPCVWRGAVWRFTVADFLILDDFERYDKSNNLIWYTWYCKQAMPYGQRSGAYLELSTSTVHLGAKAMKYTYETDSTEIWDQDYSYADACLPLDEIGGFQDWTMLDLRLVTIFFYGQSENDANDTEQMYMAVHNADGNYAEVRYGDHPGESMSDLKVEEWQRWDVPFVWFTDSNAEVSANVDFSAISSVYLGFGDRRDPVPAGNGVVYFDDLRLSMPICKPQYGPTGDFSGDCIVGVADIGEIGEQWLRSDANVNPVVNPGDANLVGHWALDGNANDSSVYANHGTAQGTYAWVSGHIGSGAIELDNGKVIVPDAAELRPSAEISAAAWLNYSEETDYSSRIVVKGIDANDSENFAVQLNGDTPDFFVRDANHNNHPVEGDYIGRGEWAHVVGTYDGNSVKCYVNGQLSNSDTIGLITLLQDANDLGIGNRTDANDRAFIGTVDDVRVYNRALTRAEVAWLASDGTGEFLLTSPLNLLSGEDPEVINFRDFAKLFEYWGDEQYWPPEPAP